MRTIRRLATATLHRGRYLGAVIIASLALVFATGVPAQAATGTIYDTFEAANAGSVWTPDGGAGVSDVEYSTTAHSPSHQGYLWALNPGFQSLGRRVHLPAVLGTNASPSCTASIWIRPIGVTKLNIEVINPSNWTYISLKTVTIGTPSGYQPYQQVSVPLWYPTTLDVFFRVSNIYISDNSIGAELDDLAVTCSWSVR